MLIIVQPRRLAMKDVVMEDLNVTRFHLSLAFNKRGFLSHRCF